MFLKRMQSMNDSILRVQNIIALKKLFSTFVTLYVTTYDATKNHGGPAKYTVKFLFSLKYEINMV